MSVHPWISDNPDTSLRISKNLYIHQCRSAPDLHHGKKSCSILTYVVQKKSPSSFFSLDSVGGDLSIAICDVSVFLAGNSFSDLEKNKSRLRNWILRSAERLRDIGLPIKENNVEKWGDV